MMELPSRLESMHLDERNAVDDYIDDDIDDIDVILYVHQSPLKDSDDTDSIDSVLETVKETINEQAKIPAEYQPQTRVDRTTNEDGEVCLTATAFSRTAGTAKALDVALKEHNRPVRFERVEDPTVVENDSLYKLFCDKSVTVPCDGEDIQKLVRKYVRRAPRCNGYSGDRSRCGNWRYSGWCHHHVNQMYEYESFQRGVPPIFVPSWWKVKESMEGFTRLGLNEEASKEFADYLLSVSEEIVHHYKPHEWAAQLVEHRWLTDRNCHDFASAITDALSYDYLFEEYSYYFKALGFASDYTKGCAQFVASTGYPGQFSVPQWAEKFLIFKSECPPHVSRSPEPHVLDRDYSLATATVKCAAGHNVFTLQFTRLAAGHAPNANIVVENRIKNAIVDYLRRTMANVTEDTILLFNGRTYASAMQLVNHPDGMASNFSLTVRADFNIHNSFYLGRSVQKAIECARSRSSLPTAGQPGLLIYSITMAQLRDYVAELVRQNNLLDFYNITQDVVSGDITYQPDQAEQLWHDLVTFCRSVDGEPKTHLRELHKTLSLVRGPWSTRSDPAGTIQVGGFWRTTRWQGWQAQSLSGANCFNTALLDNNNEQFCVLTAELARMFNPHLVAVVSIE